MFTAGSPGGAGEGPVPGELDDTEDLSPARPVRHGPRGELFLIAFRVSIGRMSAMKTTALLLLLAASIARADLVMVQETAMGEVKSKTVMSIKGKMVRTDVGDKNSVIMDTEAKTMVSLMHEQKMAMKMDMNMVNQAQGADVKIPQPVATGQKEKVGDYECEIYTLNHGGTESKMWIAKDFPGYEKLKTELAALKKMGGPAAQQQADLPGMAVKTETKAGGITYVSTLVSLKEEPVDDKIFAAPADYKMIGQ